MRSKNIVFLTVVLLMTGLASANTVWIGDANDVANWNVPENWTLGVPGIALPSDIKAVFNVAASECQVTDSQTLVDLTQGDGGPGGVIRVMDGGSLTTTGGWMAIGYNNTAKLIVEDGGACNFAGHLWWGMKTGGDGIVEINGGTIRNDQSFGLGEYFGPPGDHGQCKVYINAGELNIHHWSGGITSANPVFWNDSFIDIYFGKMVIRNNSAAQAAEYIAAGKIKGFGGLSTPTAVFANNVTTITATDPMHRAPVYTTVLAGDVDLTWTNLAPVAPATDVWVDVWFGTDPNKLSLAYSKVVTKAKNKTSVTVSAPNIVEPTTTYYWQVDSYLHGDPATVIYDANNITTGQVTSFKVTTNTPPLVDILTPPTATWIDEPIHLVTALVDDHPEDVTYLWTSDEPNAVFSPSNTVANPTVTVDYHAAQFTVTVTVYDGFNPPASASVTHDCADNACQAATAVIHLNDVHPGDIAVDCKINLTDFAAMARQWLTDYTLTAPVPVPAP